MATHVHSHALGEAYKRKEDARFIRGQGNYVDDLQLPGMLYGDIVRSPYAHALIKNVDISEAMKVPGVVAVITGKDLDAAGLAWMPTLSADTEAVLALERVHYVGTDMRWGIEHAVPKTGEPAKECMIETPHWDFQWQRGYAYDVPLAEAPEFRPNDTLWIHCGYDNTMDNKFVAKSITVSKGTTVKWVWKGHAPHNVTVTKGPVKFKSTTQVKGNFAKKLTRKGTYTILCTIHAPGMKMTIKVK